MVFNRTVTIQQASYSLSDEAIKVPTWSTLTTVQAHEQPYDASPEEKLEWGNKSLGLYVFYIAPNTSITTEHRIVGEKTCDIVKIQKWRMHYEIIGRPV